MDCKTELWTVLVMDSVHQRVSKATLAISTSK